MVKISTVTVVVVLFKARRVEHNLKIILHMTVLKKKSYICTMYKLRYLLQ